MKVVDLVGAGGRPWTAPHFKTQSPQPHTAKEVRP